MRKQRHNDDRRVTFASQPYRYNRRRMPDRRLSNISVEFIPLELIYAHADTRGMFNKY